MAKKKTQGHDFTDSAHDVWLAGLGALAAAGEEGEKLFRTLVARGRKVEKQVVRPVDQAGARLRGTVKDVRNRASKSLGGLQETIDESVTAALHGLGLPTRKEIATLNRRVEKLTRAVDGQRAPKARARTKKKAAKRPAARKKTATRRTARKKTAKRRTTKRASG